jgi:hypothetical protein
VGHDGYESRRALLSGSGGLDQKWCCRGSSRSIVPWLLAMLPIDVAVVIGGIGVVMDDSWRADAERRLRWVALVIVLVLAASTVALLAWSR